MPLIIAKPSKTNKGLIVFKHLEYTYLELIGNIGIENLKKKYYIILYFGMHARYKNDLKFIDGYIAAKSVLDIERSALPRIELNGFNFIPDTFDIDVKKLNKERNFDIAFIGDPSFRKNLISGLEIIRELLKIKPTTKIIIILRYSFLNPIYSLMHLFLSKKMNLLLKDYSSNIVFIRTNSGCKFVLPRYYISNILKDTKFLFLPSKSEGAARVYAEALLCGCSIIANKFMLGGTLNNADSEGALLIDLDNLNASEGIANALDKFANQTTEFSNQIKSRYLNKNSSKIFLNWIDDNFGIKNDSLEGYISNHNFSNAFSSHTKFLPRRIVSNNHTDECLSAASILKFFEFIDVDPGIKILTHFKGLVLELKSYISIPIKAIRRSLGFFHL